MSGDLSERMQQHPARWALAMSAGWFVLACVALALITGDLEQWAVILCISGLGFPPAALWMDRAGWLERGGRASRAEVRGCVIAMVLPYPLFLMAGVVGAYALVYVVLASIVIGAVFASRVMTAGPTKPDANRT